jgi:hypothetical protein
MQRWSMNDKSKLKLNIGLFIRTQPATERAPVYLPYRCDPDPNALAGIPFSKSSICTVHVPKNPKAQVPSPRPQFGSPVALSLH